MTAAKHTPVAMTLMYYPRLPILLHLVVFGILGVMSAEEAGFTPTRFISRQPAIINPAVAPASTATPQQVRDEELVMGLVVNNEARAYPLNMISDPKWEVLNDTLGEEQVVVTWCSMCFRPIVFEREINGKILDFAVDGSLWHNNLVMYDVQTESLWSQFLAEAKEGSLKGTKLKSLPFVLTEWKEWKQRHPDTTFLLVDRKVEGYTSALHQEARGLLVGTLLSGLSAGYSLDALRTRPVTNDVLADTPVVITLQTNSFEASIFIRQIGERRLLFRPISTTGMSDRETGSYWDLASGECLEGELRGQRLQRLQTEISSGHSWSFFYPDIPLRNRKAPVVRNTDSAPPPSTP